MPVIPHRLSAQESLVLPDLPVCLGWAPHTGWSWTNKVLVLQSDGFYPLFLTDSDKLPLNRHWSKVCLEVLVT